MGSTFKTVSGREKASAIGAGVVATILFTFLFSIIAPIIFVLIADLFDSVPKSLRDCQYENYIDKPVRSYSDCIDTSDSYYAKVRQLRHDIPWFLVGMPLIGWLCLRNALKGRIRDYGDDIVYRGEGVVEFAFCAFVQAALFVLVWVYFDPGKRSIIALGVVIAALLALWMTDRYYRKTYGVPKSSLK